MSETTNKMRDVAIYSDSLIRVRDLAADAIEAVEAQVAEAVARVAALEKRTVAQIPQECPACTGEDAGTARGGTGAAARSVPNAEGSPAGSTSPAAPSAVPAPRGFKKGDVVRTGGLSPFDAVVVEVREPQRENWNVTIKADRGTYKWHGPDLTLVRAAAAPEAPAEDAGLVERLARIIVDTPCAANHEGQCTPPGAPVDDCDRANARAVLSDLTAESRLCAPGEVARLKDELAEANGARFLNANAVRLQKARAEAAEETQRLRDAAISVCATSNTRDSAKRHRLDRSNPNWSHGYERVYEAVEREMCHRERAEAAEKERDEARAISAATAERVRNETQIATELRHDLADARDRIASKDRSIEVMLAETRALREALDAERSGVATKLHDAGFNNVENLVGAYRFERAQADAIRFSARTWFNEKGEPELLATAEEVTERRKAAAKELAALRAKPRFRTRPVTAADLDELEREYNKADYKANEEYRAARALGFRRRVDGAK